VDLTPQLDWTHLHIAAIAAAAAAAAYSFAQAPPHRHLINKCSGVASTICSTAENASVWRRAADEP